METFEAGELSMPLQSSSSTASVPFDSVSSVPERLVARACAQPASSAMRWFCRLSLRSRLAALVAALGALFVGPQLFIAALLQRHFPSTAVHHRNLWFIPVSILFRVVAVYYLTLLITRPLEDLARLARAVFSRRDYSLRVPRPAGGEMGVLIEAFNQLLEHIQEEDLARAVTEQQLRQSEERYALAVRGSDVGLWDWDASSSLAYLSPRLNAMYGNPETETWMSMEEWLGCIHPLDRPHVQSEIAALLGSSRQTLTLEYRIRHVDGAWRWMLSHGALVRDEQGRPVRMAGSQTDITHAKTTDSLTSLPNRLAFLTAIEQAFQQNAAPLAVLFLDLDNYTLFIDSLGRPAGDDLLTQVAARLRTLARLAPAGTAAPSTIARTGDDEFAILLACPLPEAEAPLLAARLLDIFREPFFIEDRRLTVSASIGVAFGSTGDAPEELLHNAQTAMFHASAAGKSQFAVFRRDMRESTAARLDVMTGLRSAIDANQLRLHYQPVVSLPQRRIVGFESLVRWQHPQRGLLGPGAFIPIAEESNLILDLGQWVLREACRQMAQWHERFPSEHPLTVGVNLSARQVNEPHLMDEVALILRQTGLDPRTLRLEITESALVTDSDIVLANLRALQRLNIRLVIDDFGTGYSSLSYLQRLPFTILKIDRSFIQQLDTSESSAEIVRTILQLGRSLNMQMVAEGVETPAQLARVTALGCDLVQGFYFSKPLDPQHAETLLLRRDNLGPLQAFENLQPLHSADPPACVQPV